MSRLYPVVSLLALVACSHKLDNVDTGPGETDTTGDDTDSGDTEDTGDTQGTGDTGDTGVLDDHATIFQIQDGDVATGAHVTVENVVVTGVTSYGLFVEEMAGGAYSGVWVYLGKGDWASSYGRGDVVTVTGYVNEYQDSGSTDTITEIMPKTANGDAVTVTGSAAEPDPTVVGASDLVSDPEPWEGVLVQVTDVTVTAADLGFGEFAADGVTVDDDMYAIGDVYEGDVFTSIAGVVNYTFDAFKVEPRDASDVVGYSSIVVRGEDLLPGDIVIDEIMVDPTDADCDPESEGEYVEIYNSSGETIDLRGLQVADKSGVTSAIDVPVVLAPGELALGVSKPLANFCYSGITPDFEFDAELNNGGDIVTISNGSGVVDNVDFFLWSPPAGGSFNLDPAFLSDTGNDDETHWCETPSTYVIDADKDVGTPGQANPACP